MHVREYLEKHYPNAVASFKLQDAIYQDAVQKFPRLAANPFFLIKAIAAVTGEVYNCIDCGTESRMEYYMVHDALWFEAVGWGDAGHVCIGCFEKRLGRKLVKEDFTEAPINSLEWGDKSERLRARLCSQ